MVGVVQAAFLDWRDLLGKNVVVKSPVQRMRFNNAHFSEVVVELKYGGTN